MRALGELERDLRTGTGPVPAAARRAVRTTFASCTGFFVFLYAFDRPVAATYALFGAVSLAGLARIPGTGRQRAAVMAGLLPVVCFLVTLGTFLAVRTWSAVLGMAVVGFCLAFSSAAGPRAAGAAPGLQLLYILPSFPPYLPHTLGERLGGALAGLLLLIAAEAWILPDPRVPTYAERAAAAAAEAVRCAAALERPPYVATAPVSERARAAAESLRASRVPEAERPAGPGLRERALAHTGLAARTLLSRLRNLPGPAPGREPRRAGVELLGAVRESVTGTAALLRDGRRPATDSAELLRLRARNSRTPAERPESRRRQAALLEVADAAVALRTAAEIAVLGRRAHPDADAADRFWYVRQSTARLWWHRLAAHTGPRSVHFQNAVRIALALAVARTVAGLDSLPHGFWAMLAVISLTRTTAVQTRGTVRSALIGTCLGALAAGTVLALAGGETLLYAIALAPLMLVTFTVGPVRGVGWAQALFTLVVSLVFAQLSAVTWQLAEVRFLDVLIGSSIGIVCGLLAWPRGAHDELARAVAGLLRACADDVESTTAVVTAPGRTAGVPGDGEHRVRLRLVMAESAYAQYQSETQRPAGPGPDWQASVLTGHHVLWGAGRVLGSADGPPLARGEAAGLQEYAARVAAGLRRAAEASDAPYPTGKAGPAPAPGTGDLLPGALTPPTEAAPPDAGLAYFATTAWLDSLTTDLRTMAVGHATARAPG
ncbi:FUSC family protein [Streptomyces vinaceus]|uniref:FUSC family protein n=1 Tax=Streptomyces vinaceus TaxID=1960 RepID=UPI0036C0F201